MKKQNKNKNKQNKQTNKQMAYKVIDGKYFQSMKCLQ